jgi:hypothetical protein
MIAAVMVGPNECRVSEVMKLLTIKKVPTPRRLNWGLISPLIKAASPKRRKLTY